MTDATLITARPAAATPLTARLGALFAGFQRRWMALQATAELKSLTDRELADIGIHRSQIPDLVAGRLALHR